MLNELNFKLTNIYNRLRTKFGWLPDIFTIYLVTENAFIWDRKLLCFYF